MEKGNINKARAHLDPTTIGKIASPPLPARHERGEGRGEGFVSAAATLFGGPSPSPSPHSFVVGRGNPLLAVVVVSRCARAWPLHLAALEPDSRSGRKSFDSSVVR